MKGRGAEWHFAEKPILEYLLTLGYEFVEKDQHAALRGAENQVIFRPHLIAALQRLNSISEQDATAAAAELMRKEDNEEWIEIMRGDFSRNVEGQATQKTLKVIDFENPSNNQLAVTQQLYVKAEKAAYLMLSCMLMVFHLWLLKQNHPLIIKIKMVKPLTS